MDDKQLVNLEMKAGLDIPSQRIDDLLCAAFEGGSTYWVDRIDVPVWPEGAGYAHEVLMRGERLEVHHNDDEQTTVTQNKLAPAFALLAKDHPHHWADFMDENEDAETGDIFFQLVCFGEVVYG